MACNSKQEGANPLARVGDQYLNFDEIKDLIPVDLNPEDSVLWVKGYINKWAEQQLLLKKAVINLSSEQGEINQLVKQYREDLLINKYKEAIVEQELDTITTQSDIDSFYVKNKDIFRLNEELLKFRYIYFGKELLNPKDFVKNFKADTYGTDTLLLEHKLQLKSYNFNDTIWVRYEELLAKAPFFKNVEKERLLKKNTYIEAEDSTGTYLIDIKDVLLRNQIAPKSYAVPTIRQMILHRRKLELLKKIEATLIYDAIENKEFQIYGDD